MSEARKMPKVLELKSPTETVMELVQSPMSSSSCEASGSDKNLPSSEKNTMKKELGLLEGCAIILGIIFGSGIFISPKVSITYFMQPD